MVRLLVVRVNGPSSPCKSVSCRVKLEDFQIHTHSLCYRKVFQSSEKHVKQNIYVEKHRSSVVFIRQCNEKSMFALRLHTL